MEPSLGLAIKVALVGLVVLLLVLAALAGIVYLLTRFVVDKKEKEAQVTVEEKTVEPAVAVEEPKTELSLAAAVAVAIARAQAEIQTVTNEISAGEVNAWRHFGLQRRLNQTSTIRRTR